MRCCRQEYWSELSCPLSGDLPNPGIKPAFLISPALAGSSLQLANPRKPPCIFNTLKISNCLYIHTSKIFAYSHMATHSSTLAWKLPWVKEPGRLQSMGSHRVGHNWTTSLSRFTFMHWRRKWQPTPVFLTRESQGRGDLVGWCLWGLTESDMTEAT